MFCAIASHCIQCQDFPGGRMRRIFVIAAVMGLAAVGLGPQAAVAAPTPRVEPCIWPDTGTNLQQYFGVTSALVIPGACGPVLTGSTWSTPVVFYVARTWEHIPAGYHPT